MIRISTIFIAICMVLVAASLGLVVYSVAGISGTESAIVIMFGAELNSEIERQTLRDTTTGRPKPLGSREAVSADTVGAAAPS